MQKADVRVVGKILPHARQWLEDKGAVIKEFDGLFIIYLPIDERFGSTPKDKIAAGTYRPASIYYDDDHHPELWGHPDECIYLSTVLNGNTYEVVAFHRHDQKKGGHHDAGGSI